MIHIIRKTIFKKITFPWESKSVKTAIVLGIAAAFCYSAMAFLVKLISGRTSESIIVFFRFAVSMLWIMSVFGYKLWRGKHFSFKTKHPGLHLLRSISGFIAIFAFYVALEHVPLVDANLLAMTYTLFIPILSFMFLGTKTNIKNWLALVVGFVGIVFILKPFGGAFNPWVLVALITGFSAAVSFLGVHELAKEEGPYTIIFYYCIFTFILSGAFSAFNWTTPDVSTILVLIASGIVGTMYQELLTRALLQASPKVVSPILYFSVIFSGFLGWLFWGYVPDLFFLFGMVLVILGCVFSILYAKESLSPVP